ERVLSYGELAWRAGRLARHLRRLGVGPEVPVVLFVERSVEMVVGLLAVLAAGGAYVPLDPAFPPERLRAVVEDAGAPVALTTAGLLDRLPAGPSPLLLDRPEEWTGGRDGIPASTSPRESLAYVIFTSGSTGRPKGVAVEHRQIAAYVEAVIERCGLRGCASFATVSTLAADLGNTVVFPALVTGAVLHVITRERAGEPRLFAEYFAERPVDVLKIVPSHLAALGARESGALPRRRLILGGEATAWEEGLRLAGRAPGCEVHNHYGPTETTVGVLTYRVEREGRAAGPTLPLGRPLAGAIVDVVEPAGELAPRGDPGELLLGGGGVARGYFGRPDWTAERFVPDPRGAAPGGRLYRSGDLGRFLAAGEVEFLGRLDRQVKIRGFRVEPAEIAEVLAEHPGVRDAVVVARAPARDPGERSLVAYWVPASGRPESAPAALELREFLRQRLPAYMVPAVLVALPALPVTANGKLDEAALPLPEEPVASGAQGPPRTPTEELLAALWSDLLGIARIGRGDDFFALGGHSLLATRLAARLPLTFGRELPLRALFESPTLAAQAARIDAATRAGNSPPPLVRGARPALLPLSFAQERLWFLEQLTPGQAAYNLPYFARVRGPLVPAALAATLSAIVRRHESLRTRFLSLAGRPLQVIDPAAEVELPEVDLAALPPARREAESSHWAAVEGSRPFDLGRDRLLRPLLLRLSAQEHALLLSLHHVVSDAWSRGVLAREISALYPAALAGRRSPLPALALQYADFALWQRRWLEDEVLAGLLAAAREGLAGVPPLDLPTDRPRPAVRSGRGGVLPFALPPALSAAVGGLARGTGTTPFMVLSAALATLLARHADATDLVLGAPVANRDRPEIEGLIGFFVNTLAVRLAPGPDLPFSQLLTAARRACLAAYERQDLPFEKLVEAVAEERALDRSPLFSVAFVYQSVTMPRLAFSGLDWEPVELHTGTAKFELTLAVTATEETFAGLLEFDADLFDPATAARLLGHFAELLAGALAAPGQALGELPLLTAAERVELAAWNDTAAALPPPATLYGLFAAQAARTPGAEALVDGERRLTYADLARQAAAWAGRLRALGVGPETRVGVCLERSADLVAALLAVLAAGGAYVPLDPTYPAERLAFMVEDAEAAVVLSRRALSARLPKAAALRAVWVEDLAAREAAAEGAAVVLPENLAYLIYTSGSTGRPKGVAITHGSAAVFVAWACRAFAAEELAAVLASTSVSFDLSVFEIFVPLSSGGKVVLATTALDLPRLPAAGEVTLVNTVPSALAELLRGPGLPAAVRAVNLAGEPLPRHLADAAYATGTVARVRNLYGPSEDTTYSTWAVVPPGETAAPAIGRPILGTTAHVLDPALHPRSIGVPGELFLGGAGLARGYLGRPGLTAERFLPDPFSRLPGARLYHTGDLARRRPDGELDFLGRLDQQVKVRGFRIELEEIAAALTEVPGVREAAVLMREDRAGDRVLVAYVADLGVEVDGPAGVRAALAARLPDFMIPNAFERLESLPHTRTGKIDRKALARRAPPAAVTRGEGDGGRTPLADLVEQVWCEVLGVEKIGLE
ncbi:MAG: hypothetical protein QOJ16_3877, partial [Acidobacteriota bacterium]|nr:hypothetical protein [Acidobacteriota bacterium]